VRAEERERRIERDQAAGDRAGPRLPIMLPAYFATMTTRTATRTDWTNVIPHMEQPRTQSGAMKRG
jgi:hypothetical protein